MSEKSAQAHAYFDASFNCAQSVFAPFAEDYDIDTETALKTASGFGGGMRCGEVCGAVSGGTMVVGAKKGHYLENDTGAKQSCNAAAKAFIEEFRARNGSIICRELLGFDVSAPDGQLLFDEESKAKCTGFIESAVELLEEQDY